MQAANSKQKVNFVRALVGLTIYLLLVPALLFICAGTIDWTMAWVYVALLLAATVGSRLISAFRHPEMLHERARVTGAEGVKEWDRYLVVIVGLYGPMAMAIIAGLDHRYGWSRDLPTGGQYTAVVLVALGYGLAVWAMLVNQFFSSVARIQSERGQYVISDGPYQFVRHPAYAGALLAAVALPFMLEALWALVPGVGFVIALVLRTKLEDDMLRDELVGYIDYMKRTRYRLVPGVW